MNKYWIVVDNAHQGPFTVEQLVDMGVSPDVYAWHPGLPKWTQIKDIEELKGIIVEKEDIEEIFVEPVAEQEIEPPVAEQAQAAMSRPTPPPPPQPPLVHATPSYSPSAQCQPVCTQEPAKEEKCPPSYLAWSIVTTILFFLPVGIAAIIYSAKVNSLWNMGNHERARKASETAAWLSNIAFVAGLIWFPFSMLFSSLI